MSDSEESLPSDVELAAQSAINTLIPAKSKERYEIVYKYFEEWMEVKKIREVSEKVVLAYFAEQAEKLKPSSLWCRYSMLRTLASIRKKIDISQYHQVVAFLKRKSEGYRRKKSRIFRKEHIYQFLKEMNDKDFLLTKVVLIVGVFGACRREEITNLMRRDVQDEGEFIKIILPNSKTKIRREFAITKGNVQGISCLDLFRKYSDLRPSHTKHYRFFVTYRRGKCTQQPVGVNTIGGIPKKIATALGLSEPVNYTGHCFRRSSASLLADAGADMHTLKRHGGWKSDSVAEGYVETSTENKKIIATKIMGSSGTDGSGSARNVMVEERSIYLGTASGVNFKNVTNCIIYVNKQ